MLPADTGLADPRAYVRLAAIVRQQIIDGTLERGQPAPSITRLSQEHGYALCVPKTSSTSCDQVIFVDQATDALLSSDAVLTEIDRFGERLQRRGAAQRAVRPVLIVVDLVLAQDPPQMSLAPDEGSVQQPATASPNPAFGDRVHTGRPDIAEHGPDASVGEDSVERAGEVGSAVADHELDPVRLLTEVHEEVACLLSGPLPGGVQRDAEDADAPGRVFYHRQDVGLGAVEQVDCEEVACQDRFGLRAQELGPGWRGPPRRGVDSCFLQDLPCRRRRYLYSQAGQFAVDPAAAPVRVLLG